MKRLTPLGIGHWTHSHSLDFGRRASKGIFCSPASALPTQGRFVAAATRGREVEADTSSISSLQTTWPGKLLVKGDRDRLPWAAMLLHIHKNSRRPALRFIGRCTQDCGRDEAAINHLLSIHRFILICLKYDGSSALAVGNLFVSPPSAVTRYASS